jgi:hypothetical protein
MESEFEVMHTIRELSDVAKILGTNAPRARGSTRTVSGIRSVIPCVPVISGGGTRRIRVLADCVSASWSASATVDSENVTVESPVTTGVEVSETTTLESEEVIAVEVSEADPERA